MSGPRILTLAGLDALLARLTEDGHRVVGPTRRGEVIDLDEIAGITDLPAGTGDLQAPGHYHLDALDDPVLFGHTVTMGSPRRHLHPPHETLITIRRGDGTFTAEPPPSGETPLALFGIRPCDVRGIDVADRVARSGQDTDALRRRQATTIIAANCTRAAETCFCVSAGGGPRVTEGHDLALTELHDHQGHRFLVEAGTDRGVDLLGRVDTASATPADIAAANDAIHHARDQQRHLPQDGLHDALLGQLEHPRWDEVASRCLSCGNCTLVCPTCFCTTVEDRTDLTGAWTERSRRWESCFTLDHSHLGEGSVRDTVHHRYRQWLTHKLATWEDQFGELGCVGCGRCITWCPVGIDLTAEATAIHTTAGPAS